MNRIRLYLPSQSVVKVLFTLFIALLLSYESMAQATKYSLKDADVAVSADGIISGCSYNFAITDIIIPNKLKEKDIRGIGNSVFKAKGLTSVELPEGLESIGDSAFYSNPFKGTLTLPTSLVTIGKSAFYSIYGAFQGDLILPPNIKTIGDYAFFYHSFTGLLTLPSGLTTIGASAFVANNFSGISFKEPSSIETIGAKAFADNQREVSVKFPARATGDTEFKEYRDNQGNKYVVGNNIPDHSYRFYAYKGGYTLKSTDVVIENGVITSCSYDFKKTDIVIPGTVGNNRIKGIGKNVFKRKGLTSVRLPDGLETVADSVFYGNFMFGNLTLPASIASIGAGAFSNNQFSGTLALPAGLTSIGAGAFSFNEFLGTLTLPAGITFIGEKAFYYNIFSGTLALPEGIISIGDLAFYYNEFSGDLILPASLTTIGGGAFSYNKFSSIAFRESSSIELIGDYAFGDNLLRSQVKLPSRASGDTGFIEYRDNHGNRYVAGGKISDDSYGYYAYRGDYTLTDDDVVVVEGVITSCSYIFSNKSIVIPNTLDNMQVRGIGKNVFEEKGLTSVKLPDKLETVAYRAFYNNFLGVLTLPAGIISIADYAFGNNLFSGTLTLPEGITSIGARAFYNNQFSGSLNLPAGITSIGAYAFGYNEFSGTLTLPAGITHIGAYAFSYNEFSGTLILPAGITSIGNFTFYNNQFSGTLTLPEGISEIGDYAFCSNVFSGTLTLPASITAIGKEAFRTNDFSTVLFSLPSKIEQIGTFAFGSNPNLSSITLPIRTKEDYWFHWKNSSGKDLGESPKITNFSSGYISEFIEQIKVAWQDKIVSGNVVFDPQPRQVFDNYVTFDVNTQIKFTALPNEGYTFTKFIIDGVETANDHSLTSTTLDINAKAIFAEATDLTNPVILEIVVVGKGKVQGIGLGKHRYSSGATIAGFSAKEVSGYRFDRWEVGKQTFKTEDIRSLTLTQDMVATAYFIQTVTFHEFIKKISNIGEFTSSYFLTTADINEEITLMVTAPETRYRFDRWVLSNGKEYLNEKQKITLTGDTDATAIYIQQITLIKTLDMTKEGSYSVVPLPNDLGTYDVKTTVTLTATPAIGYLFEKWEIGGITYRNIVQKITLTDNIAVSAYFVKAPILLAVDDFEKHSVSYYPNPAYDRLTVATEGIASVVLLSADGRVVYQSQQNSSSTLDIEVSTFPAGIYFLLLIKADGSMTTAKILKN